MTSTRELYAFLTFTAMMMVYHCKADFPPPPTGLTFKWLDPFAVKVSWQNPSGLQDAAVKYKIRLKGSEQTVKCGSNKDWEISLTGSDHWTYQVWTVVGNCSIANESKKVDITINSPKTQVKLKDTKCIIDTEGMNCSWKSTPQPFNLSYRTCGPFGEPITPLKPLKPFKLLRVCDRPYSSAERSGCYLKDNDVCILVETEAGWSTFEPRFVIHPPKLIIKEENDYLTLKWKHQPIGDCEWNFIVCYTRCNEPKVCIQSEGLSKITYDKDCLYEFRSRTQTKSSCSNVTSDFSDVVKYGSNKPPDQTLMVVAIVVPIILSVCIILSCYCFRKHSSILCPIIPDPSAIFKEMMMNGNKDHKTTGNLYTPVPEPIESCKVTVVAQNSDLEQIS
ncbi:hypothetical protein OYC64_004598 [Pagothenia borchgrevinki]|uniref:Uncharacterized protein n=1 Tax=Pagothenia borchgrevinki TaxID=8213 RepID=A0ABD2FY55_PAGBO